MRVRLWDSNSRASEEKSTCLRGLPGLLELDAAGLGLPLSLVILLAGGDGDDEDEAVVAVVVEGEKREASPLASAADMVLIWICVMSSIA